MIAVENFDFNMTFKDRVLEQFINSKYHYTEYSVIVITVLYSIVIIFGLIGNVFLLFWIRNERSIYRRRKIFDKLVISLCCSDIMVLLSCCPFSIYSEITNLWYLGSFMCTFVHYIQGVSVTSNILSMTTLSVSRYLFVCKSYSYQSEKLSKLIVIMLLSNWFISVLINFPLITVRKLEILYIYDVSFEFCLEKWVTESHRKLYSIVVFTLIYLTPCIVLITCHTNVSISLSETREKRAKNYFNRNESRKQAFRIKEENSINQQAAQMLSNVNEYDGKKLTKSQKKLSRFLMGTTLCFVLCWLPYNFISFYIDLTESELGLTLLPFSLLLGHSYSAVDPFVYWYLVKKVKKKKDIIYMRSLMLNTSKKSWNDRSQSSHRKSNTAQHFNPRENRTSTILIETFRNDTRF